MAKTFEDVNYTKLLDQIIQIFDETQEICDNSLLISIANNLSLEAQNRTPWRNAILFAIQI